ncbi:MAG: DUF3108 domain-containing protein [Burkholderiales bacterium]|nr:DUF3108 domain-containing protein [Burkholderiales bacterium]
MARKPGRGRWMARHGLPALMLGTLCSAPHGADLPAPFSASYHGSKYLLGSIEALLTLEHLGQHLRYTLRTKVSIVLLSYELLDCSVMRVEGDIVYPLQHMHRDAHNPKRNTTTVFDWEQARATVAFDDGRRVELHDLPRPTWDPMSLQVQLMIDAKGGALETARSYRLLDAGRLREWPLRLRGIERVATQHGPVDAIKVERGDGKSLGFWLAPRYDYLPVRVQVGEVAVSLTSDPGAARRAIDSSLTTVPRCSPPIAAGP